MLCVQSLVHSMHSAHRLDRLRPPPSRMLTGVVRADGVVACTKSMKNRTFVGLPVQS